VLSLLKKKYVQKLFVSEKKTTTADSSESPHEISLLKSQILDLEQRLVSKDKEIIELRKTIETLNATSSMSGLVESLQNQLEEEEERREDAEEARAQAQENEALAKRKYQEERKKRRELFEVVRGLQENSKIISDGLLLISTQLVDDLTESEISSTQGNRPQNGTEFILTGTSASLPRNTSVRINTLVPPAGHESLVFEKIAFK